MDEKERKIKRILRTPSIFNWARIIRPRADDTRFQIQRLAEGENRRSLRPAYKLCRQLALREKTFDEVIERAEGYEGFAHDSCVEILEEFYRYLIENQIEVVDAFKDRIYRFPLGQGPRNRMLTVPTDPDFVTIRGDRLEPNFILGWADDPFKLRQIQLIAGVIGVSVLSREDFVGCDARVLTFRRDQWTGKRVCQSWVISQYAGIAPETLNDDVLRYNRALHDVVRMIEES